jgi:hypothetical protein
MASLFRIGLTSVIVCLLSVATTWYTVSYYVDNLLGQFHITTPKQKQELSQLITTLIKQSGLAKNAESVADAAGNPPVANGGSKTGNNPAVDQEDDAVSVWSQTNANGSSIDRAGKLGADSKMIISAQDFYTKKEKLSDDDKMKVFTILMENLPPDQLQQISQLVEDGITETELQKIDGILRQYVSSKDYEVLMDIMNKI